MGRQHNAEETKELIISSAIENFIEKGYSKTTLEDIVKRIGLTRGAFYWNFETKLDILNEIVNRYEEFYKEMHRSIVIYDSALETLKNLIILNLKKKNRPNPYVTIIRYKVEASENVSDLRERQQLMDKEILDILIREIKRGQENGEFNKNYSAEFYARTIYTYLLGFDTYNTVHYRDIESEYISEQEIKDSAHLMVDKLLTK